MVQNISRLEFKGVVCLEKKKKKKPALAILQISDYGIGVS